MIKSKKEQTAQKIKEKGSIVMSFIFVLLLSLSVTSLMVLYIDRLPSNINEGGIATQDIRADQNYEIIDTIATQKLKDEAAKASLVVYDFDANLSEDNKIKIKESFVQSRAKLETFRDKEKDSLKITEGEDELIKQGFLLQLGIALTDDGYKIIRDDEFSAELEHSLIMLLDYVQRRPILLDKEDLELRSDTGIVLRRLESNQEISENILTDFSGILSLDGAKKFYDDKKPADIQKKLNLEFTDGTKLKQAFALIPQLLKSNVNVDKTETEARKIRAISNVQSVIYKLQKGQIIIRRGDRYEERHITMLDGIRASRLQTNIILKFFGVLGLVLSSLLIVFFFAQKTIRGFQPTKKDLNFLGLMLILFLAMLRLGSFVGSSMQDTLPFSAEITTFYYAIPIAAGAMMVRFILNPVVSLIFAIILSLFSGLFLEQSYELTTYYFLSSLMAAYLIGGVERRSSVLRKGFYLGATNLAIVLSLNVIHTISNTTVIDAQAVITNCIFAFMVGMISTFVLLAFSPIMEAVFNYTTNIQLLELANMNHPLLREMIVRAPGTYLHSQLVGTLAESGTRAIGGNSLLARVGSYYHDIGKMKKPQYFIENQKGVNPHDNLAPSMSALIIDAHVKDGLDMANEYKLPKIISDFIPEHQGTKLIGYFYHKAQKEAGDDKDKVDERDYRYKGPKPQSRESGAVMLSDTIEAAVRSMPDKSPQKIRAQVEKLVNMHFVDGQLDECDLTLRDLHLMADAFVKILIGIYHQRVEYPSDGNGPGLLEAANTQNGKLEHPNNKSASQVANISPLFKEKR